jgi:hypothetical protein
MSTGCGDIFSEELFATDASLAVVDRSCSRVPYRRYQSRDLPKLVAARTAQPTQVTTHHGRDARAEVKASLGPRVAANLLFANTARLLFA